MNKKSSSVIPHRPTMVLTHCLPLLAQAALLSTWNVLVLGRRADPAAAAAAVATALHQVSMWKCRDVAPVNSLSGLSWWNQLNASQIAVAKFSLRCMWGTLRTACLFRNTFKLSVSRILVCKGVDRELYELTISKLETSVATHRHHPEDSLSRLMSSAERTSTLVRSAQGSHPAALILVYCQFKAFVQWAKKSKSYTWIFKYSSCVCLCVCST